MNDYERAHHRMTDALVGKQLSGVAFVADYVEFHFDGPVLRVFTKAAVSTPLGKHEAGEPGFRDAFCSLIGTNVANVEFLGGSYIRVVFQDRSDLTVPIDEQSAGAAGGDAATFQTQAAASCLDVY